MTTVAVCFVAHAFESDDARFVSFIHFDVIDGSAFNGFSAASSMPVDNGAFALRAEERRIAFGRVGTRFGDL